MMRKALVVVDMQNDFISGVFGSDTAEAIVEKVRDYVASFDGDVFFTQDTHLSPEFLEPETTSYEEKNLAPHCIYQTWGWEIVNELKPLTDMSRIVTKSEFGSIDLGEILRPYEEIEFCGVCTDMCVLSNVVIVQTQNPYAHIVVLEDLCAGSSKFHHEVALRLMQESLLISVRKG